MNSLKALVFSFLVAFVPFMSTSSAADPASGRVVQDAEGQQVTLPAKPQRVIALSEIDLDSCLALGLTPVGTISGRGQAAHPHYLQSSAVGDLVRKIPIVGDLGRPNVEAVIKLKPDLILTSSLRPELLTLLRKIAPTVVTFKNGDNWQGVFRRVATVLDRDAEENSFMKAYHQEVQVAKDQLKSLPKTVSIIRWNPTGPAFMYQDSFASLVLREMGLERPAAQKVAGERHSMPLSLEALDVIDADWLFIGTLDPRGDAAEALQEINKNTAFQRLSSVKAKRFFTVDGSKWTSIGGPLAALSIVKETSEMMTADSRR